MASLNYYKILGVSERSDEVDIKRAYRKLAFKYHPDRNPGDKFAEDQFKKVTEAYRVLSDSKRRASYDRTRSTQNGKTPPPSSYHSNHARFDDVFDIFDTFSSNKSSASRKKYQKARGADLKYEVSISFEEAALGTTIVVEVNRQEPCTRCRGTGIEPRAYPMICPTCLGKGRVRQSHGLLGFTQVCQECEGSGRVYQKECAQCRGESRTVQNRKISVKIPPNVTDGTNLRVAGEGDAGMYGGIAGDLYITVHVQAHEFFGRQNDDIWYDLPLTITQAILGDVIEVPTLDGKVRVRIPPGTQSGRVFRLSGKGVPTSNNGDRGDFFVRVKLEIPESVSTRQRQLLEEFARLSGDQPVRATSSLTTFFETPKARLSSWIQRIRERFQSPQ